MAEPRPEKKNTKQALLKAFERSVAERGYAETALSEVAAEVGVSKGTIVHHFRSKEQMLADIHVEFMRRRMHEVRHIKQTLHDPVDQLVAIIYAVLVSHRDDYNGAKSFMREITLFATSPNMADVREIRRDYQASVSEVVQRGMDEGAFRKQDIGLVTIQIFAMCNHTWTWYRPGGQYSMPDITRAFVTNLLEGMAQDRSDISVSDRVDQAVEVVEEAHKTSAGRALFSAAGKSAP